MSSNARPTKKPAGQIQHSDLDCEVAFKTRIDPGRVDAVVLGKLRQMAFQGDYVVLEIVGRTGDDTDYNQFLVSPQEQVMFNPPSILTVQALEWR